MSETILDSYLLKLGAKIDVPSFGLFNSTLGKTKTNVLGFAKESGAAWAESADLVVDFGMKGSAALLRFQTATVGAFVGITASIVGFADHVAMADQEYRFFGQRMLMGKDAARALTWAMDDLGVSIDQAVVDPEAGKRLQDYLSRYEQLGNLLDKRFDTNMQDIRSVTAAAHLLEREFEVLGMRVVSQLWDKLGFGSGKLEESLLKLDNWFMSNIPAWSEEISTDLVPIMKDAKSVFYDTVGILKDLGLEFTNLVGVFSGDDSIEGTTFDFHKFAVAVQHVSHGAAELVHILSLMESVLIRLAPLITGVLGGAVLGGAIGLVTGGPAGMVAGAAAGALGGAAVGGTITLGEEWKRYHAKGDAAAGTSGMSLQSGGSSHSMVSSQAAIEARTLAEEVARRTGASPDLIYSQWAHETGDFTSPALRNRNNLGGIRYPHSDQYRDFKSLADSASYYEQLMESRYPDALRSKNPADFAHNLLNGRGGFHYYGADEGSYAAGLQRHLKDYGGSSAVGLPSGPFYTPQASDYGYHGPDSSTSNVLNIQPGAIQVNPPSGASAKDVASAVVDHISDFWNTKTRTQIGTVGAGVSA
jgi:outer membrane lipoprotein SlyB